MISLDIEYSSDPNWNNWEPETFEIKTYLSGIQMVQPFEYRAHFYSVYGVQTSMLGGLKYGSQNSSLNVQPIISKNNSLNLKPTSKLHSTLERLSGRDKT